MAEKENIHAKHRQRFKERLLNNGIETFSPHEILELLLFFSIPRRDTNAIGHALINRFGSLSKVFDASIEELCTIDGISEHSAFLIRLIPELCRMYMKDKTSNKGRIGDYDEVGKMLTAQFVGLQHERVIAVLLDPSGRIIEIGNMFDGSVNSSSIEIRKISEFAFSKKATGVIIAHNHPNGVSYPSPDDVAVTRSLMTALKSLDITLCEHYVIAEDRYIGIIKSIFSSEMQFG